jgi:hypothetical protein
VVVRAHFELRDINEIDDETETFEFEGVLTLDWRDDRHAFDPVAEGTDLKLYQGAYQFNEVFTGWFPQAALVNGSGLYEQHSVVLRIRADGSLRLIETLNAAAKTDLDLRAYPFDTQHLEAEFEILGMDANEVVLEVADPGAASEIPAAAVRMPQWTLTNVGQSVRSRSAVYAGESGAASTFVVNMGVERRSLFTVRLVIVPLVLIVVLSWSVFWMEQSSVGDRISVSFIGILTIVAYQFVLSEILPHISYLTWINGFLNMSYFVMCGAVGINLWVGVLDRNRRNAEGDRIDRLCRWLFPVIYLGLLGVVSVATIVSTG